MRPNCGAKLYTSPGFQLTPSKCEKWAKISLFEDTKRNWAKNKASKKREVQNLHKPGRQIVNALEIHFYFMTWKKDCLSG